VPRSVTDQSMKYSTACPWLAKSLMTSARLPEGQACFRLPAGVRSDAVSGGSTDSRKPRAVSVADRDRLRAVRGRAAGAMPPVGFSQLGHRFPDAEFSECPCRPLPHGLVAAAE